MRGSFSDIFLAAATRPIGWEVAVAAVVMLGGLAAFVPLRHLIHRAQLGTAYFVLILSAAVFAGIATFESARLEIAADPLTYWLNRIVVGALLFVLVRLIDRLIVVPAFSRGGTTQVPRFFHQLILMVLSIFVVLIYGKTAFGWPINDFLTGGAVVSIVIGLALQESLGNLFSGLVLQAAPPFVLGDFISAGHLEGRVVDMSWRAVTIQSLDDNYIVIPNGTIAKQEIINFNAPSVSTARLVKVSLEEDVPPSEAVEVLTRAALATAGVQSTPPPVAILLDFADSAILYGVKFWIDEPRRHLRIEHEVRLNIWYHLRDAGYSLPSIVRKIEHVRPKRQEDESAERERMLAAAPLLKLLSDDQRQELAADSSTRHLPAGQKLFSQNDPGDSLFIVCRGSIEILVHGTGGTSLVATLGKGDLFGEMSALTGQPRNATARAGAAVTVIEIDKANLQQLVDADPSLLEKISDLIARRNLERDAHVEKLATGPAPVETLQTRQRSLVDRMKAFFQKPI